MVHFDKIIIGAGFYGLYAALFCAKRGQRILVVEFDDEPFSRATYVNQARIHNGYHYPRSFSTAIKSAQYFERFVNDFNFCINKSFEKIYAISATHSWTNGLEFLKFCEKANIFCREVSPSLYFNPKLCERAFITKEFTYDAILLRKKLLEELSQYSDVEIRYSFRIKSIQRDESMVYLSSADGAMFSSPFLLNATYASINQLLDILDEVPFNLKYELCEIIICDVGEELMNLGITVMDGPFFSVMPFGKSNQHSLTSVTFTPHETCYKKLPSFPCMATSIDCLPNTLSNCNKCNNRPKTAWPYMSAMARKYLKPNLMISYKESYFSIKPILLTSEIDDSRPTVILCHCEAPKIYSVLSGKINTVFDLDTILE